MTVPDAALAGYWEDLLFPLNSDVDLTITLVIPGTSPAQPYNLTGCTVNLILKPSRQLPDNSGITLSCTVQSPATAGIVTANIPKADNQVPGIGWYRVDVVSNTETKPAKFGKAIYYAD